MKRFKETASFEDRYGRGRNGILSEEDCRALYLNCLRNRRKALPLLVAEFNIGREFQISLTTARRYLKTFGLIGRVAAKKPLLRPQNVRKRLVWALKHRRWTLEQWYKVLFTDETKTELYGSKRRTHVRRRCGERYLRACIQSTVKHGGGSVMAWGGMSAHGLTPLKRIVGIMDKKYYHGILQRQVIPGGLKLIGNGFVFQEDNDPKHASKYCRNYIAKKEKQGIQLYLTVFFFKC